VAEKKLHIELQKLYIIKENRVLSFKRELKLNFLFVFNQFLFLLKYWLQCAVYAASVLSPTCTVNFVSFNYDTNENTRPIVCRYRAIFVNILNLFFISFYIVFMEEKEEKKTKSFFFWTENYLMLIFHRII